MCAVPSNPIRDECCYGVDKVSPSKVVKDIPAVANRYRWFRVTVRIRNAAANDYGFLENDRRRGEIDEKRSTRTADTFMCIEYEEHQSVAFNVVDRVERKSGGNLCACIL